MEFLITIPDWVLYLVRELFLTLTFLCIVAGFFIVCSIIYKKLANMRFLFWAIWCIVQIKWNGDDVKKYSLYQIRTLLKQYLSEHPENYDEFEYTIQQAKIKIEGSI